MDTCELAATGIHQGIIIGVGVAIVLAAATFLRYHRKLTLKLGVVLVTVASLLLMSPLQSATAQATLDCPSETKDSEPVSVDPDVPEEPESPVVAINVFAPYGINCGAAAVDLAASVAATTTEGIIDWSTVDLDPDTPGVQQSIDTGEYVAAVDASGVFSADGFVHGTGFSVPFTVMNDTGLISNTAYIMVTPSAPGCF